MCPWSRDDSEPAAKLRQARCAFTLPKWTAWNKNHFCTFWYVFEVLGHIGEEINLHSKVGYGMIPNKRSERNEDPVCLSGQHLQKPHGGICDEGYGEEGGAGWEF